MCTKKVVGNFGELILGVKLATVGAGINVKMKSYKKTSPFESIDENWRVEVRGRTPPETNVGISHVIAVVETDCSNVLGSTMLPSNFMDTPLRDMIFLGS
jgi:hypothetical protein